MKIETSTVKATTLYFDSIFGAGESFVTMTEWVNGEGYDVFVLSNNEEKRFSLHYEEFNAVIALYHAFGLNGKGE